MLSVGLYVKRGFWARVLSTAVGLDGEWWWLEARSTWLWLLQSQRSSAVDKLCSCWTDKRVLAFCWARDRMSAIGIEASWTICRTSANTAVAVLNCNCWCTESRWSTLQWLYCHTYCMICCDRDQSTRRNMYQTAVTVRTSSPSSVSTMPTNDSGTAGSSMPLKPMC